MARDLEEAAVWRKSSRSSNTGGDCVEVAVGLAVTAVRDSKNPGGPVLVFQAEAVTAFLTAVKTNHLG